MFETSRVVTRVAAPRRYGLFTASVAIHTAVVVGIVAATLSSLRFPTHAPSELPRYLEPVRITLPPALGVRQARPPVAAPRQPAQPAAPRSGTFTPDRIPDAVQPFSTPAGNTEPDLPVGDGSQSSAIGEPTGVPGGISTAEPAQTAAEVPDRVYQPVGEVRSAVVIHRVEPQYPRAALTARIAGVVVLECIIDKDGHVRDARVLRSSFSMFDEPALTALQQWRFAPGSLRGRPVDTWFELTVAFQPR